MLTIYGLYANSLLANAKDEQQQYEVLTTGTLLYGELNRCLYVITDVNEEHAMFELMRIGNPDGSTKLIGDKGWYDNTSQMLDFTTLTSRQK